MICWQMICRQMICGSYAVLGAYLIAAARNPCEYRSLISCTHCRREERIPRCNVIFVLSYAVLTLTDHFTSGQHEMTAVDTAVNPTTPATATARSSSSLSASRAH
jgi:hypothetical protein